MITSNRKFGVEIEFSTPRKEDLKRIQDRIRVVDDGSIRHVKYAGEYVSPILQGEPGVQELSNACEVLKKYGANGLDQAMSVHIHLDGQNRGGGLRSSRVNPKVSGAIVIAVSNRMKEKVSVKSIQAIIAGEMFLGTNPNYNVSQFDGVTYLSMAKLTKRPLINYTYYWLEKPDRFKWLRNVFYFYTLFSPVMEDIVSKSRRFGNMYCIPLGKSYDLDMIEGAKNMGELKEVWYKNRPSAGHYDDSRYHNINLHCFWDRHGTVEIRSHGGTIDPDKILLWLKLHQKIVDKLEDVELNDIKFTGNIYEEFIKFVDDPLLANYIKRLLGYYSGIKVK